MVYYKKSQIGNGTKKKKTINNNIVKHKSLIKYAYIILFNIFNIFGIFNQCINLKEKI